MHLHIRRTAGDTAILLAQENDFTGCAAILSAAQDQTELETETAEAAAEAKSAEAEAEAEAVAQGASMPAAP